MTNAIEITGVSVSQKGTVWIQAKLVDGETPKVGEIHQTTFLGTAEPKEKKGKKKDDNKEN